MIHSITATNPQGESLKMELARPEGSGLIIRKVDGLGPVKATVNLTSVVGLDVSTVNSTSLDPRNIVFDIELMAQPTIEKICANKSVNDLDQCMKVIIGNYRTNGKF